MILKGEAMSKIVYLGYYSRFQDARSANPAGATLMEYIAQSVKSSGLDITVVSPAQTNDKSKKPMERVLLNYNIPVIYLSSLKRYSKKNYLMRFVQKNRRERKHYKELLDLINDGDTVIAYHSLALIKILKKLRKKKNFRMILQVGEIYADVFENKRVRKKEVKFISGADSYIFSSKLLEEELNKQNKKFVICLGKYSIEPSRNVSFNDDKVHVVYAGTLDPRKGGAIAAVNAAAHLPEEYRMHILGFGSESEIEMLNSTIKEINRLGKCKVTYEGCLPEEEYIEFLQKCQIGLSTQNPNAIFNATYYPSKILVYLSNGLQVVTVRIPAVETSGVVDAVSFYDVQTPENIANAVMSCGKIDGKEVMNNLNEKFVKEIVELLEK